MIKDKFVKTLCMAAFLGAINLGVQSAFADTAPVPTLDAVKEQEISFLDGKHSSYVLTALGTDETAPEGAITVKIGDTTYYYTPSENVDVLKTLASTGSTALIETSEDKALYTVGDKYYTYDSSKLKDSAYRLEEAASADDPNTITLYEKETVIKYFDTKTGKEVAEGDRQEGVEYKEVSTIQTTPKYYTVSLKQTEYGDKNAANAVAHYYKWTNDGTKNKLESTTDAAESNITYWQDPSRTAIDRVTTDQNGADINKDFIGLNADGDGGAIDNWRITSSTIGNITGDFIGNYASSTISTVQGGAIYNEDTIGDIAGNFIDNYAVGTNVRGGAIYNRRIMGNVIGDFIGNYVSGSYAYGGAISNAGEIGDITGDFITNYLSTTGFYSDAYGGAIYNGGIIINLTGDFIDNYLSSIGDDIYGGAIYNGGTIINLTGDFIDNYASAAGGAARGGAIYNNTGTIECITGNFIGNYAYLYDDEASGGAISNYSGSSSTTTIGDITGDFIGNYAFGNYTRGGAIFNEAYDVGHNVTIGDITGDFTSNYVSSTNDSALGGAIYNHTFDDYNVTIGDITGDFINNYALSVSSSTSGGAILNSGSFTKIGNIIGDFIGNYASGNSYARGGAVYNSFAIIGDITGDFIGNYASSTDKYAYGGAIYNINGTIGKLDDEGNLVGGIYGSFINNYAKTESDSQLALGGGVYTSSDMNFIADNQTNYFSGNYTEDYRGKINNAIFVQTSSSSSPTIKLEAQNNGAIVFDDQIDGGVSKQNSETGKYEIDRTNTYNLALTGDGTGTVSLYNDVINANVTSDNVTVDFANGETGDYDLVSMKANEGSKLNIDLDLTNKVSDRISTLNTSTGTITLNLLNFIGSESDPAVPTTFQVIKNTDAASSLQLALGENINIIKTDTDLNTDIVDNFLEKIIPDNVYNDEIYAQEDGISLGTTDTYHDSVIVQKDKIYDTLDLIATKESENERNFTFRTTDNYMLSKDLGTVTEGTLNINGKGSTTPSNINAQNHTLFNLENETALNIKNTTIENAKDFAIKAEHEKAVVNLNNASFKNTTGTAIQSKVAVNITADGGKSEFSGNTAAIYLDNADKKVSMNSVNQGEIVLEDVVDGQAGYSVTLNGDDKSKITVNNNINNANISLDNTNLYLGRENVFDGSQALTLNSGAIYLNNDAVGTMHVPTLNLSGTTNLSVDVDLANEQMDRVTADNYNVTENAILNVTNLNLLSTTEKSDVKILFADEPIANNVAYSGGSPISYKGTNILYSPIYKYTVNYGVDETDKLGYFFFNRATSGIGDGSGPDIDGGAAGNISDAFNPAVLTPSVVTQAGAYTTQLQTFNYAFQHADTFMNIPYLERVAMINANKYAMSPTGDATDVGVFSPLLLKEPSAGFWVKPYASFENIPLKNGPKVDNINYGTLVGYDTALTPVKHGFERVITGYVGYNGASQRYSGVDAYQNGGLIGTTATFYKGNFFNATTLSVGASVGDASTMYGSENYTMLLAGIGNKTGYNFEFFDGRMILQPNFLISYTFVNTFDYNNAAGVRIESDPLHAIQLAPGIKLIGNTKNGWQPYLGVNMVWNLLDDSKVYANDVRLPEMSIKPYVQYGVGLQKRFKDKFLAFGQAMIHNGGRNGISFSFGLRWKIGKD